MYVFMYICMCVCMYVRMYKCVYVYMHFDLVDGVGLAPIGLLCAAGLVEPICVFPVSVVDCRDPPLAHAVPDAQEVVLAIHVYKHTYIHAYIHTYIHRNAHA